MNHALAYLVNHLNVLAENIQQSRLQPEERTRILQMSTEALESAERLGDLIRQVKVLSWGSPATRSSRQERGTTIPPSDDDLPATDDDTWDSEHSARILVIDDEAAILQACQRALQTYAVDVANTAERAMELIKVHQFDLILCDLNMPGVSGMEIFDWMKAHQAQRLDRLVFMTGGVFSSQLRTFLAGIRNPVLHKPFDTKTLRWMVAQKLREFESRRSAT
jgi:CheY-like chemotaxis protein